VAPHAIRQAATSAMHNAASRGVGSMRTPTVVPCRLRDVQVQVLLTLEHRSAPAPDPIALVLATGPDGTTPHLRRASPDLTPPPPDSLTIVSSACSAPPRLPFPASRFAASSASRTSTSAKRSPHWKSSTSSIGRPPGWRLSSDRPDTARLATRSTPSVSPAAHSFPALRPWGRAGNSPGAPPALPTDLQRTLPRGMQHRESHKTQRVSTSSILAICRVSGQGCSLCIRRLSAGRGR
jgi:hypothetical protein